MGRPTKAAALVFLCALMTGAAFAHDEADDRPPMAMRDKIRIVALNPRGCVRRRVETKFTIEIEADLGSAKEGIARVGFNVDSPISYRIVDRRDLHGGRQMISLAVRVVPVDWSDQGQFAVMVNIGPKTAETQWAPTAFVRKTIPVKR